MARKALIETPKDGKLLTSWLSAETVKRLDQKAQIRQISRSSLAREIFKGFLNTQEQKTQQLKEQPGSLSD